MSPKYDDALKCSAIMAGETNVASLLTAQRGKIAQKRLDGNPEAPRPTARLILNARA